MKRIEVGRKRGKVRLKRGTVRLAAFAKATAPKAVSC